MSDEAQTVVIAVLVIAVTAWGALVKNVTDMLLAWGGIALVVLLLEAVAAAGERRWS